MDDMRQRYRLTRRDYGLPPKRPAKPSAANQPIPKAVLNSPAQGGSEPESYIPESLKHAYQPPPAKAAPHRSPLLNTDLPPDSYPPVSPPRSKLRRFGKLHHHRPAAVRPAKQHKKPRLHKALILVSVIMVLLGAGGIYYLKFKTSGPLPASLSRQVPFALYYPSNTFGYSLVPGSSTFQAGLFTYKLAKADSSITVVEQQITANPPDISSLPGYSGFKAPVGNATVGTNFNRTSGIVVTATTLLTFNTAGNVPKNELKLLINSLSMSSKPAASLGG